MPLRNIQILATTLILSIAVGLAVNLHIRFCQVDTRGDDIYYAWMEGKRILRGENPYARVLAGDMRENDKYATYFPLFYLLSALTQLAGFREYAPWILFWRQCFLLCSLGIAALLFGVLHRKKGFAVAIFAVCFWLFNRWSVYVGRVGHLDFPPLLFLLLSLHLLPRRKWTAFFLFSVSLALKQIAVFVAPLYLIWAWRMSRRRAPENTAAAAAVIASLPVLLSIPFLWWNAEGYLKSLLFSMTRYPLSPFQAETLDVALGMEGLTARLPMLGLLALVYLCAALGRIGVYTATLFVLSVFLFFNPVLFNQYFCWLIPFFPLLLCEFYPCETASDSPPKTTAG